MCKGRMGFRRNGKKAVSGLRRFFVDKVENITEVRGDEFSHAVNTLRLSVGDELILCDDSGFDFICRANEIGKGFFKAETLEKRVNEVEAENHVSLICGYLKGDKTELVVQKAVELGVHDITVFSSEYSSAYMNGNKLARLNKVSLEAAKQCGRSVYPKVSYCDDFASAIQVGVNCKNRLFFYENITNYSTHISEISGDTALVIGSEGGFSEIEVKAALGAGYKTVSLGKRILRAETAAICATSLAMFCLGELQ